MGRPPTPQFDLLDKAADLDGAVRALCEYEPRDRAPNALGEAQMATQTIATLHLG